MHRSLVSMQDLPILSEQGVRLGATQDAYFDPSEQRIIAFVVDWENDMVRGPENILPIMQISELTADVVTVPSELGVSAGLEYAFQIETEGLMLAVADLVGKPVGFQDGALLGELVDMQFDPADGSVAFYEIAPAQDTLRDQPSYLLAPEPTIEFQADRLMIPDDAKHRLTRRVLQQVDQMLEDQPQLNVAFLEANDERVGEEDIEVTRSQTQQPY
ncbi:MAG: PRC-barrel domain-containing protein [Candidatus Sericytochromatia bacterium]